jgi:hypothetical protein
MNAKYASKPNLNPNEPNAAWPKLPASESFTPAAGRPHFCHFPFTFLLISVSSVKSVVPSVSQKQTQFFYDQICVINIKNEEMEAKNLPKKTKQTQLLKNTNVRLSTFAGMWCFLAASPCLEAPKKRNKPNYG